MLVNNPLTWATALEEIIWGQPKRELVAAERVIQALMASLEVDLPTTLAELSDETLAMAVQKGFLRNAAFEEWLVQRYERALLRWFFARTGDANTAQDLTQELYLKLLTNPSSFNAKYIFQPWLWTVVRNLWIGEHRHLQKRMPLPDVELVSLDQNPQEEAAQRELENRLIVAMEKLPEEQKRVFREALQGADAQQIGLATGFPKPKVFRLLFKARRFVGRCLGIEPLDLLRKKQSATDTAGGACEG